MVRDTFRGAAVFIRTIEYTPTYGKIEEGRGIHRWPPGCSTNHESERMEIALGGGENAHVRKILRREGPQGKVRATISNWRRVTIRDKQRDLPMSKIAAQVKDARCSKRRGDLRALGNLEH